MKKTISILAILLSVGSIGAKAQLKKDACALLTDAQINKTLGCNVKQAEEAMMKGIRCVHKAADFKTEATLEYYDWHSAQTAADMLKLGFDENKKNITAGKKAVGVYTTIKEFTEGGKNACIMTGPGDITSNGNLVRIQFVLGTSIVTFDTKGIDMAKVAPKAKEIYKAIVDNNK